MEPNPRNAGEKRSWNTSGQCRSNASQKTEARRRILRGRADFHLIANRAMEREPPNAHVLASPDNNTHSGI